MTDKPDGLSPDTLERLVGRAAELDERAAERVTLAQAREIAMELGISAAAWDAAVAERLTQGTRFPVVPNAVRRPVHLLTATCGFVFGTLGGWLNLAFSGNSDVAFGTLLVLGGVLAAHRAKTATRAQLSLAAWWLAIPAGVMVAMGELLADPVWFSAFAWLGCAGFLWALPRALRCFRRSPGPTLASSA
jgi:hypothetical protein